MPSQPVEFPYPAKGVQKNPAYNALTLDSAADALNIRPYDQGGRRRIAQRSGVSKVWAAALTAGQPVQGLMQATTALDPATVVPSSYVVDEQFSYSNGSLATVSGGVWTNSPTIAGTGGGGGTVAVVSQHVENTSNDTWGAYYTTPPFLGVNYVVSANVSFSPLLSPTIFHLSYEVNNANPTNTGWSVRLESNGGGGASQIKILKNGVSVNTVAGPALVAGVAVLLEARITGSTVKAYANSTLYATWDMNSGSADPYAAFGGFGFLYASNGAVGSTTFILDSFRVSGGAPLANLRQTNVVAVCGGSVFEGTNLVAPVVVTGGTTVLSGAVLPGMTYNGGHAYLVDGLTIQDLNLSTQVISTMVASAGTLPSVAGKYPTLAATWRGRLVLAAPPGTPQNFYLSRVNAPTDFDYSQVDSAAAFAGNASTAGNIGEPIVSLMPFSDDLLFIGGDHNLWVVRGDPADGGSIDPVSDAVGMAGANAWTRSPDGTLYFVGTGGLFKIAAGGTAIENLSAGQYNEFFRAINRASHYVVLAWDRDQQGLHIFVTTVNAAQGGSTHLWFESRSGGLWPIQLPDSHGPICSLVYDGDSASDRTVLLGGRDGYVRQSRLTDKTDDGTAISSNVVLGPVKMSNFNDVTFEGLDLVFGEPPSGFVEADWNVVVQVISAPTVEKALNNPLYTRSRTFTASRRPPRWSVRARGNAFFLKFSNSVSGKTFALETATAQMRSSGLTRRR